MAPQRRYAESRMREGESAPGWGRVERSAPGGQSLSSWSSARSRGLEPPPRLCHQPSGMLSQFHLQAQLSHPQDLRALVRDRPLADDLQQDL